MKRNSATKAIASLTVTALLMWTVGLPSLLGNKAEAAYLSFGDTLTSSAASASAIHTGVFVVNTAISGVNSIKVTMADFANGAALLSSDITLATSSNGTTYGSNMIVANVGSCSAGLSKFYPTGNDATHLYFSHCTASDNVASGVYMKYVAGATNKFTNPAATGTYEVVLGTYTTATGGGTLVDSGEASVAIVDQVTLSATVDSNLTFAVSAVNSGTDVGADQNTDVTSTATTIPFGEIVSGTPKLVAQSLAVTTNAYNGYSVTVQENQDPTSVKYTDAKIRPFKDGSSITSTAAAWASPTGTLADNLTWAHWGVHSNDTNAGSSMYDATTKYAAVATSTSGTAVMYHSGVADGTTAGIGQSYVSYKMGVSLLQPAATDYTNTLTYIATPSF